MKQLTQALGHVLNAGPSNPHEGLFSKTRICVERSNHPDMPITEEQLSTLVERFYAKVRNDALLGPLFNGAIGDWPSHLERLSSFWSSVMLTSGRYKGNPMAVHLKHRDAIRPAMFGRWLELWGETAHETLNENSAAGVIAKADRIAESLQLGLFFSPDSLRDTLAQVRRN